MRYYLLSLHLAQCLHIVGMLKEAHKSKTLGLAGALVTDHLGLRKAAVLGEGL